MCGVLMGMDLFYQWAEFFEVCGLVWIRTSFGGSSVQVLCKFRLSFAMDNVGCCPFLSNSLTSLVFTAEFIEFVLGVPELLENGQRPDVVCF
jgi:hypothetical protein